MSAKVIPIRAWAKSEEVPIQLREPTPNLSRDDFRWRSDRRVLAAKMIGACLLFLLPIAVFLFAVSISIVILAPIMFVVGAISVGVSWLAKSIPWTS